MPTSLEQVVRGYSEQMLGAYREQPLLVDEHAGLEENIAQGGYGRRQIHELIQNGADELLDSPGGRIHVVLTDDHLYCANQGSPITREGVAAILLANVSPKRGVEIGRFGLGFKSVLGVTSRPEFFSEEVSFGFDRKWAAAQISEVAGEHDAYPALRIAQLRELALECEQDPILEELMDWATTVVRLPLEQGREWLADDLESFNPAFLLFSPHVGELRLEDRTSGLNRSIAMTEADGELHLEEDDASQRWRVFRSELEPSDAARKHAGKLQHREALPVVWAVPLEGRLEIGQFWAFFPLRDQTTLSGIANAPWQVNDDRTGLLENSTLNEELCDALVDLVFSSLPDLVSEDDSARVLDLMPARGREARCWGDQILTDTFNRARAHKAIVPDQEGVLRRISELRAPLRTIPTEAQTSWAAVPGRPNDWVHPSASTSATRRNRVADMLEAAGSDFTPAAVWLEALAHSDRASAEDSAAAILVAGVAARVDGFDPIAEGLCDAHVVLNDAEEWSRIHPEWVWVEPEDTTRSSALVVVNADVLAVPGVRDALEDIGIAEATPLLELQALLSEAEQANPDDWETIWTIAREVEDPEDAAADFRHHLKSRGPYFVRAGDGEWRPNIEVLLPGRVISPGDAASQNAVVDDAYHGPDLDLLRAAGMSDGPVPGGHVDDDPRTRTWKKEVLDNYERRLAAGGSRPQPSLLEIDRLDVPTLIGVLPRLQAEQSARFVDLLIELPGVLEPRATRHSTSNRYPVEPCESPTTWAIRKWGYVHASLARPGSTATAWRVSETVSPALDEFSHILPVAQVIRRAADRFELPSKLADVPETTWALSFTVAAGGTADHLGELFSLALRAGIEPLATIQTGADSPVAVSDIVVATPRDDLELLRDIDVLVALVASPSDVDVLVEEWGMRPAHDFVQTRVVPVEASEPLVALDLFPGLVAMDSDLVGLKVICCDEVVIERSSDEGSVEETVESFLDSTVLYVDADPRDSRAILDALVEQKGWELTPEEVEHTLAAREAAENRKRYREAKNAQTIEDKILLAIGRDALVRHLPKQLLDEMADRNGRRLADEEVAKLAMAVHGVEVLLNHKADLANNGLGPPTAWAGGQAARRYVLDLGFPKEYAGFESASQDPLIDVPGTPNMDPLHDFQQDAASQIRELIRAGRGRGMLSLPTGAGKTRTAVQALVEAVRDKELTGPILWVAQTNELCEQAVTSWAENWRAFGPAATMRLSRLWSTNEVQDLDDPNQVVVATIAKLNAIFARAEDARQEYDWLSRANAVVIDEAHRATTPEYTDLLRWLGMGQGRQRAPVIGLSATPFKGVSEEQNKALINRFDGRRLDRMGDNPYGHLQDIGVLARVEHQLLDGSNMSLTADELEYFNKFKSLPKSVLARVGKDKGRNQKILDSIGRLDDDFTVLLFAASVPHAELLAGLLSAEGIPSRAISSRTQRGARHHYVSQFRRGEIRVLTNFGVLTEGFDAPKVRAVYVARPTYSPNLYQQMIGRGLRGPRNGGEDLCLIVNVKDNLEVHGTKLAYTEWDHLWQATGSRVVARDE